MLTSLPPWRALVRSESVIFVAGNVAVNLLTLARSYVAMKVLGYGELGMVTVLQTVILLVGLLQFGVINGGYRLVCSASPADSARINDLVWTVISTLTTVSLIVGICATSWSAGPGQAAAVLLGVAAGGLTLLRTWMSNQLIATVRLRRLNCVNMLSAGASMLPLGFVTYLPIQMCMLSIVLQPLVFVLLLLRKKDGMRPVALRWSMPLVRRVLAAGSVVFLTGVFLMVNTQVERWLVIRILGVEALGHLYLALLFVTLHALVPNSFDAVFLPRMVRAHASGEHQRLRRELQRYIVITLVYTVLVVLFVMFAAGPLLQWLLPRYVPDLKYVILLLPGLAIYGLVSPLAMIFNVLIQYRFYFIAFGSGTVAMVGLLAAYIRMRGGLDLAGLSLVKSLVYAIIATLIVFGYMRIRSAHPELRLP